MIDSNFTLATGQGGLPYILIESADGARAEIYLHGGHVTRWVPAGQSDNQLFLSRTSGFAEGIAIRGGVPVIFPQFAAQGPLPKHGFARNRNWQLQSAVRLADGSAQAILSLQDSEPTRAIWPYAFKLELQVRVFEKTLELVLTVTNLDQQVITFTNALHTYLGVTEIDEVQVFGLQHQRYQDSALGLKNCTQASEILRIQGEVDRIYNCSPAAVLVQENHHDISITTSGFTDTVVWNPGADKGAAFNDMQAEGYRKMLCIEAAVIENPIRLDPGASWTGKQILTSLSKK